jgi:hypothetical protein
MEHFQTVSESSFFGVNQCEPADQAALFIFNGASPGKDLLSRVASCFECCSVQKSTFIAEEGLMVRSTIATLQMRSGETFSHFLFCRQRTFLSFLENTAYLKRTLFSMRHFATKQRYYLSETSCQLSQDTADFCM